MTVEGLCKLHQAMPRGAVISLSREALGMVTSTVLTLVVISVLYYLWRRREVTM